MRSVMATAERSRSMMKPILSLLSYLKPYLTLMGAISDLSNAWIPCEEFIEWIATDFRDKRLELLGSSRPSFITTCFPTQLSPWVTSH